MSEAEWIASYVKAHGSVYLMCEPATRAMSLAFPDLTRVRGYALTTWGKRTHWWMRAGTCLNCGEEIWEVQTTQGPPVAKPCSERCALEFAASCMAES